MNFTKPVLDLRPVEAPAGASPGATVYVLLPTLDQLLGHPGFGLKSPIVLPDALSPLDPHRFFGVPVRPAFETLH